VLDSQRQIAALEAALRDRDAQNAELAAQNAALVAQVAALTAQVERLTEELGRNSRNSNRPPSSDPPGRGQKLRKSKKRGRKRGGQPGHKGSRRELLPTDEADEVVDLFPHACENCWAPLPQIPDRHAKRYQVTDLRKNKPHLTEYQRHAVRCVCGYVTRRPFKDCGIPASPFGPRLTGAVALLTGVYHLSRRKASKLLAELMGVRISVGAVSALEARVSQAVAPAVAEARARVDDAPIKHTDGTNWRKAGAAMAVWTIATAAATVFAVVTDSPRATLRALLGKQCGILVSDRAKALQFWAMDRRQICWAHLLRKFVSFSERDGPAGRIGRELVDYAGLVFHYWTAHQARELPRAAFRAWMRPVRVHMEATLERAVRANIRGLSGSCADILAHRDALWTYVDRVGVEPTNNHAERELRGLVLWRKRSFGTQSERGDRFVERIMTVAHTARKQGVNALAFLAACCRRDGGESADGEGAAPPAASLFRFAAGAGA